MRRRISIRKEDRIWQLRCQGYTLDSIGRIVNVEPSSVTRIVRRVRRRPPLEQDPVRRGRRRNWIDADQIADIRWRRQQGESLSAIAADYWVSLTTIYNICAERTYITAVEDGFDSYPFSFPNRLRAA